MFWSMHPTEFWLIYEAKKPVRMYGSLTEQQAAEIYDEDFGGGDA